MNNQSPLTMCDNENFIRIQIRHNTLAYKALRDMLSKYAIGKDDECEWHSTSYRVPKSEFEKEELQLMKKENIKFKAKKTLDGKWIKGDLVHHKDSDNVWMTDFEKRLTSPIDPFTICQFTGLKDCKGNELYEHDVIKNYPFIPSEIVWSEELSGYYLTHANGKIYEKPLGHYLSLGKFIVVGNTYENTNRIER